MAGGRLPGSPKVGGRQKGSLNKATIERKMSIEEAYKNLAAELSQSQKDSISPRDLLVRIMRAAVEAGNITLALAAAEKAAPYFHPRLANTTVDATIKRAPSDFSDAELLALAGNMTDVEEGDAKLVRKAKLN